MTDPFDLERFVSAQAPLYRQALAELQAGQKRSHWMWFIFPQIAGLGHSAMARRYALSGREEARAYLSHPVLGPRLRECCQTLLAHRGRSATAIFGHPDDLKLRSSLTLFDQVAPGEEFAQLLQAFFQGQADRATLERLPAEPSR